MRLVIMGVCGSGKSTLGEALATSHDIPFKDADSLHPAANVEKMKGGTPLNDEDRTPWLQACAAWLQSHPNGILACSALKSRYRAALGLDGKASSPRLIFIKGSAELVRSRAVARVGHFMPPSLVDSQFEALEEPMAVERAIVVEAALSVPEQVTFVRDALLGKRGA
jgi:gluconokinase